MLPRVVLILSVSFLLADCGTDGKHFTCDDVGRLQYECMSKPGTEGYYKLHPDYATEVADVCRKKQVPQECIDCVGTTPCTYAPGEGDSPWKPPLVQCFEAGVCPP